ncbi:MAG: hypothetical protein MJ072_01480 [Clostridia bacterium]|nr:hypothetical protein [Clostridia bacterium]
MKRLFPFFLFFTALFTLFPSPTPITAKADDNYLRVINEDVGFYASVYDESPLFFLPCSFFVRKVGESGEFVHVECFGVGENSPMLDGFVYKSELVKSDDVYDPFLSFNVTTAFSSAIYYDKSLTSVIQYVFKDRTLGYYGKAESPTGEKVYYVAYNGKLGYMRETDLMPFTVPLHPIPIGKKPTEDVPEEVKGDETERTLKIAVIVSLAGAFFVIFGLIVLPEKKERRTAPNDD